VIVVSENLPPRGVAFRSEPGANGGRRAEAHLARMDAILGSRLGGDNYRGILVRGSALAMAIQDRAPCASRPQPSDAAAD